MTKETRLGDLFNITSSKRVFEEDWKTEGIPFYRAREIVSMEKGEKIKSELFITKEKYNELKNISGIPKIGDILVTAVGTIGVPYVVKTNEPFYFKDGNLIWFKVKNSINSYFLKYIFQTNIIKEQIERNQMGTTVATYTIINAKKTKIPKIDLVNQNKIVNYLDNKTSKIDSAVAELEKQKSLLIELKKSTIHQAVTKGLDLTVPMKDSGVEWIGKVPNHWGCKNVKNVSKIEKGKKVDSIDYKKTGYKPLLSMAYLRNQEDPEFVPFDSNKYAKENDCLILWDGANAGEIIKSKDGILSSTIALFKIRKNLNKNFFYYLLKVNEDSLRKLYTGMGIPHVSGDVLKNTILFLPKNSEQDEIVTYLDKKTAQIDQSIEVIDNQIAKMKEYKKTLINDVVTGKIKVV